MESLGSPYRVGLNPTPYQMKFIPTSTTTPADDLSPLHLSVYFNKTEFIDSLIVDYQIPVNFQDEQGNTALMVAGYAGNVEAARELLLHNASKSTLNKYGQTAILVALRYGHGDVVSLIIKSLSNPFQTLSTTDSAGYTVLHYAGYCDDEALLASIDELCYVDDMMENNVNPTCSTPLHIAAMNGSAKTVAWLLRRGANPSSENCMGQSPLLLAIKNNHVECVDLLLDISPANVPDNYGQLALHHAAVGQSLAVLNKVYNRFPDAVNRMDTNGNFPFHHAVKSNNREILDFFYLSEGPHLLKRKNSNGMTPLMLAVACGAMTSFRYLCDLGADLYVSSMSGTTPFLLACAYGQMEMVETLFRTDPSVIADVDATGNTAAHFAVQNNQLRVLSWINHVAPEVVRKENMAGETPMHIACLCGYQQAVENLQTYGLSLTALTNANRTPFHYAVLGGHSALVKFLRRSADSLFFMGDKNKLTPLHYCCMNGAVHLIDDIISGNPALIDVRDNCGRTPLHVAVVMNDALCVRKLIELGADRAQGDIRKMTPEQSAINRGFIHCYELLTGKTADFIPIKKVRIMSDFLPDDEQMLRVKANEVVDVLWEHRRGWALGVINGRYGLFPISKGTTHPLSPEDTARIDEVLKNKKMVMKTQDRKNRSASVACKTDGPKKDQPQVVDPSVLVALQQNPQAANRRLRRTKAQASAKDV